MAKKPSADLFHLIKSLSRNEKGYFKKYVSRHTLKGENNYVRLFDAIDRQKTYDEDKLLRKESYIRQLPLLKNYLYQMILESLENFYSKSRINIRLYNMITRIQILYNKGLYDQCHKMARQIKKMAYRFDEFSVLLETLKWEKVLLGYELTFRKLEDVIREENEVRAFQQQVNDLQNLSLRFLALHKQHGTINEGEPARSKLKTLIGELPEEKKLHSFTAWLHYLRIQGYYYYMLGDWESCFNYREKLVSHCEENSGYIREEPAEYISAIHQVLNACSPLNNKDAFFGYLQKLKSITEVIPDTDTRVNKGRIFAESHNLELRWYIMRGEFEKGLKTVEEVEKGLGEYDNDEVNQTLVQENIFNIAFICFGAGQYEQALKWITKALDEMDQEHGLSGMLDFRCRLLKLMVLHEKGDFDVLESEVKHAFRFAYTKQRTYKMELFLLDFFRKLAKTGSDKSKTQQICREFIDEMPELKEDTYEKSLFDGFDFLAWVRSRMEGISYIQAIKEKAVLADKGNVSG
ncbi:MAG: hypothetical protein KDD36_03260 [Flavobacteriales bacterium]|nr:hypothetical protein [Flavobacteriales bacterium]